MSRGFLRFREYTPISHIMVPGRVILWQSRWWSVAETQIYLPKLYLRNYKLYQAPEKSDDLAIWWHGAALHLTSKVLFRKCRLGIWCKTHSRFVLRWRTLRLNWISPLSVRLYCSWTVEHHYVATFDDVLDKFLMKRTDHEQLKWSFRSVLSWSATIPSQRRLRNQALRDIFMRCRGLPYYMCRRRFVSEIAETWPKQA